MTPQERQMLADLLGRINNMPAPARDAEADAMIREALGTRPDALYILTQLALIHEMNLQHAQQQIQELQQRQQPVQNQSSFLGGPWGQPSPAPQSYTAAPSFLHSALSTASGIVAGEMAFSALRSLFGGGSYGWGGNTGFPGSPAPTETTVNNYYGNDGNNANNDFVASDNPGSASFDDGGSSDLPDGGTLV